MKILSYLPPLPGTSEELRMTSKMAVSFKVVNLFHEVDIKMSIVSNEVYFTAGKKSVYCMKMFL